MSAVLMICMLGACGSKKQASSFDGNKLVENAPAITKALERPDIRAYGTSTQFDLGFATRNASAAARQALAAQIMQIISGLNKQNNYSYSQFATDNQSQSASAKDEEAKAQDMVQALIADIPVSGAAIIENNIYKTKDGQYQVFVCVEYQGGIDKMASDMAGSYRRIVEQKVSKEKRAEIDKNVRQMEDDLKSELKRIAGY